MIHRKVVRHVDLQTIPSCPITADLYLFTGDQGAIRWEIIVTDGGAIATLEELTIGAAAKLPGGQLITIDGITIDGNRITIEIPAACCTEAGELIITCTATDGSNTITLDHMHTYIHDKED